MNKLVITNAFVSDCLPYALNQKSLPDIYKLRMKNYLKIKKQKELRLMQKNKVNLDIHIKVPKKCKHRKFLISKKK